MEVKTLSDELRHARFVHYASLEDIITFMDEQGAINEKGAFDVSNLNTDYLNELERLIKTARNNKDEIEFILSYMEELDASLKELMMDY